MSDNFILNKIENERAELNEKIEKISSFLDGKNRKLISPIQDLLLTLQLDSMKTYFDILTYRITCLRNEYNAYINKDLTSDYLSSLSSCSADLNLIKQKDYSQLIRLFKCAEEQNEDFVKDVEAFDELVTKLNTGEFRIVKR